MFMHIKCVKNVYLYAFKYNCNIDLTFLRFQTITSSQRVLCEQGLKNSPTTVILKDLILCYTHAISPLLCSGTTTMFLPKRLFAQFSAPHYLT